MSFNNLGLRPEILKGVTHQGYTKPTPIQAKSIPIILARRDILAGAQTGTGKTAAFTLPLLHLLSDENATRTNKPRALILAPTRELAAQVAESISTYGKGLRISSMVIFGGVGINPQIKRLRQGVDIVIGTPGRLLDLCNRRALDLSAIEFLVLDEADRMLDMGFIHDIRKVIKMVPNNRQTLFFSATYSKEIKALADTILNKPELVEVAQRNTAAEGIEQCVYRVEKTQKRALLSQLIKKEKWSRVLVFTRTKHGANRLTKQLTADGITSAAIHGNKSQNARTKALADFKSKKLTVLVATDIAARGLDIEQLPHVVNYDLPEVPEDYVHRIGRTGRAGSTGEAISLVSSEESKLLTAIERVIKNKVAVKTFEGFKSQAPHKPRPSVPKGTVRGQNSSRPAGNSPQRRRRQRSGKKTSA